MVHQTRSQTKQLRNVERDLIADGFVVVKSAIPPPMLPTPSDVAGLRGLVMREGFTIFNPDHKRLQCPLPTGHVLLRTIRDALDVMFPSASIRGSIMSANILHSTPGCRSQQMHRDYDLTLHPPNGDLSSASIGLILGLEEGTLIQTSDGLITFGAGDMVIFLPHFVHGGGSYCNSNTRLHVFVERRQLPIGQVRLTYPI